MGRLTLKQRNGSASDAHQTPQAQCTGTQRFEWCYLPYAGSSAANARETSLQDARGTSLPYARSEEAAPFLPAAQSFLYPPVSHAIRSAPGIQLAPEDTGLNDIPPLFSWDSPNIQFSAYKKCRPIHGNDRDGYILRVYENQGKATLVKIRVNGYKQAYISDMSEKTGAELPMTDHCITLNIEAYKVVTIKFV